MGRWQRSRRARRRSKARLKAEMKSWRSPRSTARPQLSSQGQRTQSRRSAPGWEEQGRRTKALAVSHAFHSPLMEPMLEEFAEVAGSLAYREPKLSIVSNLTGEPLSPEQATDPAYWVRHVREPVRFADAIATLAKQGTSTYLELGPDPVLLAMAGECLGEERREGRLRPHPARGTRGGGRDLGCARHCPRLGGKARLGHLLRRHGGKARAAADLSLPEKALLGRAPVPVADTDPECDRGSDRHRAPLARSRDRARRRGAEEGLTAHRPHLPLHPPLAGRPRGRR